jgi:hypothetical protein
MDTQIKDEMDDHVASKGEMGIAYKVLTGNPTVTRPRRRRVSTVEKDFGEIQWESVDWIQSSGQGPEEGSCAYGNEL